MRSRPRLVLKRGKERNQHDDDDVDDDDVCDPSKRCEVGDDKERDHNGNRTMDVGGHWRLPL